MHVSDNKRTLMAFAAAPLPAALIMVVSWVWAVGAKNAELFAVVGIFVVSAFCVYLMAIIGGIPMWITFRAWQVRSLLAFVLGGSLLGEVGVLILVGLGVGRPSDASMTFAEDLGRTIRHGQMLEMALAGASSGATFWAIRVKGLRSIEIRDRNSG